jgi:probable rRNA maturation factor
VRIGTLGTRVPMPAAAVRRAVRSVLAGERVGAAVLNVTYLSTQRMRALNRRVFGRDRATDVIAFAMRHGEYQVGDVYVCPAVAERAARAHDVPTAEEQLRVLVHGTLHALGQDHPAGPDRVDSPMWKRQERYVRRLRGGVRR